MFKLKTIERMLEVILTEAEIAERSKAMSKVVINRRRIKAEAKSKAEGYAAEIKLLDQQIEAEASIIEDGKEFRKVICAEQLSHNKNEVEIVRTDTGEIVAVRELTPDEKQAELFDSPEKPTAETCIICNSEVPGSLSATDGKCARCWDSISTESTNDDTATTSGTPIEAELPADEIQRLGGLIMASNLGAIDKGEPIKTTLINGNPYVVTGGMSQHLVWWHVEALPILPMDTWGKENTRTRADAYAEYEANDFKEAMSLLHVRFNAGTKKKPDWWVIVGPSTSFKVRQRSQYDYETILAFVKNSTSVKNPEHEALRLYETGDMDRTIEVMEANKSEQGRLDPDKGQLFDTEPEPKPKKRGKLKLHTEQSYEAGL